MRRRSQAVRPQPAMVVAVIALVLAAGGTSYAALTITGRNIQNGAPHTHARMLE